jgi:hypothetical protein
MFHCVLSGCTIMLRYVMLGYANFFVLIGRPSRRWEDNIRMDLREIGWEGVESMHLA